VYPCPEKVEERREMLANLGSRIADLQIVSDIFHITTMHTTEHCVEFLQTAYEA